MAEPKGSGHRHHVASEWAPYFNRREQHQITKELNVFVEHQYRHLYPKGDSGACCTEERTVVRIYGSVTSAVAQRRLTKKLAELQGCVTKAVRR